MAKDRFYRSKPHVNVGTISMNLMNTGFSAMGATQVANGQMPTDPADQLRMVSLLQELASREVVFHTVELTNA